MISKAFMDRLDLFDNSVVLIPRNFTLQNFKIAALLMDYRNVLFNTLQLSVSSTVLSVISCSLAGYGFARYNFRFKNILFALVIFTIIVPPNLIMLPMYFQFREFDFFGIIALIRGQSPSLLDSFSPFLILSSTAMGIKNGLYIFIFRQFFRNMPIEIEESAFVDGAGPLRTFLQIMVPNAVTSLVTVGLFSFVWQYNDVVYSSLFLTHRRVLSMVYHSLERYTPEVYEILGTSVNDVTVSIYYPITRSTGVLMILLPLLFVYFISQKFFVESIERTGIVG